MSNQLAQKIRAKYPGAYDDLTDEQLSASVKTKYPGVYDDLDTPADEPSLTGRMMDAVSTGAKYLGIPGAMVAGAADALVKGEDVAAGAMSGTDINQQKSWDDVLGSMGMESGYARAGLGFLGDVVLDPTNLIPAGLVGKFGKAATGAVKGIVESAPMAEKFIQYKGLDKIVGKGGTNAQDFLRLHNSTLRHEGEKAATEIKDMFGASGLFKSGIKPEQRQAIAYALDKGEVDKLAPELQTVANNLKGALDKQYLDEVAWGIQDPKKAKPNYITYLTKGAESEPVIRPAVNGKTRFALDREFKTLEDAVNLGGATDDAAEIGAVRLAAGRKAIRNNEFLQSATETFGTKEMKTGFRKLKMEKIAGVDVVKKGMADKYFPAELADELEKVNVFWRNPSESDNFLNNMTKLWKGMATSISPGHHFVNFIGNAHNMWLGGLKGPEVARGLKDGYMVTRANKIPAIKGFTPDQIADALEKYEIKGTSNQLTELASHGVDKNFMKKEWNPLNPDNKVFSAARHVGTQFVEEPARVGFFLERLRKGDSLEQAAIKTKDVLFDYAELTDTERKIRQFVPFYTWTRKNIPLQVNQILEDPRRAEKLKDFTELWWNAQEGSEKTTNPEWMNREGWVPGPVKGEQGSPSMMRMPLPSQDPKSWIQDPAGEAMSMIHPLAQILIGAGTKVDPSSGIPIDSNKGYKNLTGLGKVVAGLAPEQVAELFGIINTPEGIKQTDWANFITSKIPISAFYSNAVAPPTGHESVQSNPRSWALNFMGLTNRAVTPEDEARAIKNNIDDYKKRLKQSILMEK